MKKLKRNPEKFEVFDLFSAIAVKHGYILDDPIAQNDFIEKVRRSLESSKNNNTTIHGKRIESMFAYVVGALGKVALLKQEDAGNIYYLEDDVIALPDYRITLKGGSQLLVEVKNYHPKNPSEQFSIKKDYYNKLARYAKLNNVELKFAIYFSLWNSWIMVSIDAFEESVDSFTIDFPTALAMSEMSIIGDCWIGTKPDLEMHFLTNEEDADEIDHNGQALFISRDIKFYCAGNEILTESEKELAFYLIRFGKWVEKGCEGIFKENKLMGMKFIYSPDEQPEQNFSIIGTLSSMISKMYGEYTVSDGKVIAVDIDLHPQVFKIFIPENYEGQHLPLWRLIVQRNSDFLKVNKVHTQV